MLILAKARIFLLVDLQDFLQIEGLGGGGGGSENEHLTGHFQSFFFNIYKTNSKTSKVNQIFIKKIYFPENYSRRVCKSTNKKILASVLMTFQCMCSKSSII